MPPKQIKEKNHKIRIDNIKKSKSKTKILNELLKYMNKSNVDEYDEYDMMDHFESLNKDDKKEIIKTHKIDAFKYTVMEVDKKDSCYGEHIAICTIPINDNKNLTQHEIEVKTILNEFDVNDTIDSTLYFVKFKEDETPNINLVENVLKQYGKKDSKLNSYINERYGNV